MIKTVGTLKDVSTCTHALMHTRAYLQRARACWKWKISMCFITYKPITTGKKARRRPYATYRQVAATVSLLGILTRKQPHNWNYYLQIIRFLRKKMLGTGRAERLKPGSQVGGDKKKQNNMLLASFYSVACRTDGHSGRGCLRRACSCGRYMGFKEQSQKPRPPPPEAGCSAFLQAGLSSFPTRTPLTWAPPASKPRRIPPSLHH